MKYSTVFQQAGFSIRQADLPFGADCIVVPTRKLVVLDPRRKGRRQQKSLRAAYLRTALTGTLPVLV